ncbi:MAG: pyrroline-5-carboxylate reductase [Alphaproteobacteria bacterium]|nr:pyrroline-5-carboxylate reductase [Alphaproteobacteria bacterium]
MGTALLKSWLDAGVSPSRVSIRTNTPESAAALAAAYDVYASPQATYTGQDIVIFGVKPQILPEVLPQWKGETRPLYISLAAGFPLAKLHAAIGESAHITRAMPNTPSMVGKGMTSLVGHQAEVITALFEAAGKILWLKDESYMDAAAAIAGSGPAYLFHFAEALIANAVALGFSEEDAKLLVSQTLAGSTALAEQNDWQVASLRQNVTSKAGVTEAALKVLMPELTGLLEKALKANIARSETLKNGG